MNNKRGDDKLTPLPATANFLRFQVLPGAAERYMILMVLTDAGQVLHDRNPVSA